MLPAPETDEERQKQTEKFLKLFADDDCIELVTEIFRNTHGKYCPYRPGRVLQACEVQEISARLNFLEHGAYCSINPIQHEISGRAPSKEDVTRCAYTLIEADELSRDDQWAQVRALNIPVAMAVWSGGKSIHLIVRIDADDQEIYAERVKLLHEYLQYKRYPLDRAVKNLSRLTRIPGCRRNGDQQYIVSHDFGFTTWDAFESWVTAIKKLKDQRSQTSVQNGLMGGRPPVLAQDFADSIDARWRDADGKLLVRQFKNTWYAYDVAAGWSPVEIRPRIVDALQEIVTDEKTRISARLCEDIIVNLNSTRHCRVQAENATIPFWLTEAEAKQRCCFTRFPNGILNVTDAINGDNTLLPLTPDYFAPQVINYNFDPSAQCPRWLRYLSEVQPLEDNRIALQMLAGHVISGRKANVVFILLGEGGTGKSVYAHILRCLVGTDNCCAIQLSEMGDRFNAVELTRHRLNIVEELPVMSKKDMTEAERLLKMCSDGGVIKVEEKYKSVTSAESTVVNVFVTNALPEFNDPTTGLWRRLRLIKFSEVIAGKAGENTNLREELEEELPGIYNWALQGAAMLDSGKAFPKNNEGATILNKHKEECDPVSTLIRKLFKAEDKKAISRNAAYGKFRDCAASYMRNPPTKKQFNDALQKEFPTIKPMLA